MNLSVYFLLLINFQPHPIKSTVDLCEPFCVLSSHGIFPTLSNQAHCGPVWSFLCTFLSLYISNLIQSRPLWTFMNLSVYFLLLINFQPHPIKSTVDLCEPFCVLSSHGIFPTLSNQAHCGPVWSFVNLSVYSLLMVYFQPYPITPNVDLYEPFCVLSSLDKCPTLSNQVHCGPLWTLMYTFISWQISNLIQSSPLWTFMDLSVYFLLMVYFQPYPIKPTVDLYEPFWVLSFCHSPTGPKGKHVDEFWINRFLWRLPSCFSNSEFIWVWKGPVEMQFL